MYTPTNRLSEYFKEQTGRPPFQRPPATREIAEGYVELPKRPEKKQPIARTAILAPLYVTGAILIAAGGLFMLFLETVMPDNEI